MGYTPHVKELLHLILALGFVSGLAGLQAITINNFDSKTNDRFANDSRFIADNFDLSGVGRTEEGSWGILLSRNVFISAIHFRPLDNAGLTFYKTNDPDGDSVTIKVRHETGMQIDDTDIWLGVLEAPVPSGYIHYNFASEEIQDADSFNKSPYANENAYIFGHSPTGFSMTQNVAVGRNVLNGFDEFPVTGFTGHGVTSAMNSPLAGTHEAALEKGDSGGPMFVSLQADQLTLVGVNWFILYDLETHETRFNGFSYTGNHNETIQAFIDNNMIHAQYAAP